MKIVFFSLLAVMLTSCYRMPGDEDYCLIPATNNPSVTGAAPASLMPSTNY